MQAGRSLSNKKPVYQKGGSISIMADQKEIMRLNELAYEMRKKLLNLCGNYQGAVHIGGDLSMTDLLIGLYHYGLNVNPKDIHMPTRDRFVLSKGHAAVCMYIAMAMRGFFDYNEIVSTYGQLDSAYGMHPCKVHLPGVECSSGSLGHGLPMAVGMAISARTKGENHRVYCMVGDGESAEGSVWEAATVAHSQNLGNLIVIVDRNRQFMTSFSEELIKLEPYTDKWKAFGFRVVEIDGHNMTEIVEALDHLPPADSKQPTAIIANTIKGKGVSFMEKNLGWHAGKLGEKDLSQALAELDAAYQKKGGC